MNFKCNGHGLEKSIEGIWVRNSASKSLFILNNFIAHWFYAKGMSEEGGQNQITATLFSMKGLIITSSLLERHFNQCLIDGTKKKKKKKKLKGSYRSG